MSYIQKLELNLQKLFQQKKYSEIVFEITSKTKEEERSSGLFNLLGISRISNNQNNKDVLLLALKDFKKGYLKEKNTTSSLDSLANFIVSSVLLRDLDINYELNYDEILDFYKLSEKFAHNHRAIHIAMTMVYRRLNYPEKIAFHFDKIIKSKNLHVTDLCSYGYWRCFDKTWKQNDFFDYGKFLDKNLSIFPRDNLINLSKSNSSKVKIGFLSSDIVEGHSITYFLKTILFNYDKEKFEIFLFLNNSRGDQTTKYFTSLVDKTINIFNLNNINTLNQAREFKLDIMIDLMGYTSTQRIELFKNRMAKNQIIWMGYCNTTGVENMDYIISDPNLIRSDEEKFYSEKVIYLPKIWNCHCGFDFERIENPPPFIKNDYFTFGSFNSFDKINSDVIEVWSNILKKINNSKLILKTSKTKHAIKRIKKLFEKNNVLDSIKFIKTEEVFNKHLDTYNKIDIALDTFPYNGVTTSFEAIWMGVPVITMSGYNFNSRCGESINKNLNMERLIAKDEDDYIQKVVNLTNNTDDYFNVRKSIFLNAIKSPLFDTKDYSKSFFGALEGIVK